MDDDMDMNENVDNNTNTEDEIQINEAFMDYLNTLDEIQLLEERGQAEADIALNQLKDFLKDYRICPPETIIKLQDNELDIKTKEIYKTNKIMEIEKFTGFDLIFKDKNHYIFQYMVKL